MWSHLFLLGGHDLSLWLSTISTLDLLGTGSLQESCVSNVNRKPSDGRL